MIPRSANPAESRLAVTRRAALKTGAWAAPVVAVAATTPLAAASVPGGVPDLRLTFDVSPVSSGSNRITSGTPMTLTLTITNIGTAAADGMLQEIWVILFPPPDPNDPTEDPFDFNRDEVEAGLPPGWTFEPGGFSHSFYYKGQIPVGSSQTITIQGRWTAQYRGDTYTQAQIFSGSGGEENDSNNDAGQTIYFRP